MTKTSLEQTVAGYHSDWSWMKSVMEHFDLDQQAFSELLACYYRKRNLEGCPIALPDWASEPDGEAYGRKVNEIRSRRNWHAEMQLADITHLELMAREPYKVDLHKEWLTAIAENVRPGCDYNILDYGCGVSSFSELVLNLHPEVRCT